VPKTASDEPLIGAKDAADLLGVDPATVVRWVHAGRVTPITKAPGKTGAWLFSRAEIARLARDRLAAREGAA
jgi:predicted site-specific integrase-resolvase